MQEKGSVVSVANRLGAERSGVRIPVGTRVFSKTSIPDLGPN